MALYIDTKFIRFLGPRLPLFKQKSEYLWNFRCPICGDSHKSKFKARGYFYRKQDKMFFSCHNCHTSLPFYKFLKQFDKGLSDQYNLENFQDSVGRIPKKEDVYESIREESKILREKLDKPIDLPSIESLPNEHFAKTFVLNRKIPKEYHKDLFFASDFKEFIKDIYPEKYEFLKEKEPRLVIPFWDDHKNLLGVQGRALDNSKVKYITIKPDGSKKVFGLDRLDPKKKVYVVEGPIDSMFLDNSLATMDSALYNIRILLDLDFVFIYDNEPRNKDIVDAIYKTITLNQNVCIWPSHIEQKDINEMVLAGYDPSTIQHLIDKNTFSGLRAQLEFSQWKKI